MNLVRDYLHCVQLFVFSKAADFEDWFKPRAAEELRRFQNAALTAIGMPLLLIVGGSALGAISWNLKAWVICFGMLVLIVQLLILAWQRALIVTILGVLFEYVIKGTRGVLPLIRGGIVDYVQIIMYIMFTEITVGIIAIILPVHENPLAAFVAVVALIGYIAYSIYSGTPAVWPRVAKKALLVVIVGGLLLVLFPPLQQKASERRESINKQLSSPPSDSSLDLGKFSQSRAAADGIRTVIITAPVGTYSKAVPMNSRKLKVRPEGKVKYRFAEACEVVSNNGKREIVNQLDDEPGVYHQVNCPLPNYLEITSREDVPLGVAIFLR